MDKYLVEEISRQESIQAVTMLLFNALIHRYNEKEQKYIQQKDMKCVVCYRRKELKQGSQTL